MEAGTCGAVSWQGKEREREGEREWRGDLARPDGCQEAHICL